MLRDMGIVATIIDGIISAINPVRGVQRAHARGQLKRSSHSYLAAKNSEPFRNFLSTGLSANADLEGSIEKLRERSRHAYRNYPGARAAIEARVGIIIASGIDLEPNTGNDDMNAKLREIWRMYEHQIDASGQLHFKELQRQGLRVCDLNGSALWQVVNLKDDNRLIPMALHAIEADQLAMSPVKPVPKTHNFSNGVEYDKFGKPLYYHIQDHPGDTQFQLKQISEQGRRIPAAEIIHVYDKLRPGQSIGQPILVASLQRLVQEEELIEAELESSKLGASFAIAIQMKSELEGGLDMAETEGESNEDDAGNEVTSFTSGVVAKLNPGEEAKVIQNTRPSQQISPFREMLRGDIASTMGIARTDLDKDYSKANYSSMRAAMLDKRRQLTPVQFWFGRGLISALYLRALPQLAVKAGLTLAAPGTIERIRQERHTLVPDGWEYVDPEKDIKAALLAIHGGLSTFQLELGRRGLDVNEIHTQLKKEIDDPLIGELVDMFDTKKSESKTESTQTDESGGSDE